MVARCPWPTPAQHASVGSCQEHCPGLVPPQLQEKHEGRFSCVLRDEKAISLGYDHVPIPPAEKSFNFFLLPRVIKHIKKTCVKSFRISNFVGP
jgi:hypothetical protein